MGAQEELTFLRRPIVRASRSSVAMWFTCVTGGGWVAEARPAVLWDATRCSSHPGLFDGPRWH
jgi:hypothetical protein